MRLVVMTAVLAVALGAKDWFIDYELDAYYSNVGLYIGLDEAAIRDVGDSSELAIYRNLMREWYRPKVIVLEASVNPMPVAGVAIKKHAPDTYDALGAEDGFNLVRAVTAGFNDPYALSLFLGNVVTFSEAGHLESQNKGYMGFLISAGEYHIRRNELIEDEWLELEWKIKGDRDFSDHRLSWSFRVGGRFHRNENIADTWFLSLRRGKVDFVNQGSWLDNAAFEYTVDFSQADNDPIRHFMLLEKNFPEKAAGYSFSLGAGLVWDSYRLYRDETLERAGEDHLQFMFRPNIIF
jgi:hypothetical protein